MTSLRYVTLFVLSVLLGTSCYRYDPIREKLNRKHEKENTQPTPTPEPTPEPNPDPTPDPNPNPQPDPNPDPQPNPDPTPNPDPNPQPDPNPDPQPNPDPTPNPDPNPQPDPNPDPQPNPDPTPNPDPNPQPDPNPNPQPNPDPTPNPDPNPQPDPNPNPQPNPDPTPDPVDEGTPYLMDFESWYPVGTNYELPQSKEPFDKNFWASGSNEGFKLIPGYGKLGIFPVTKLEQGYKGTSVRIQTRPGKVILGMGSYLVPGSLYSGSVRSGQLAVKPLAANHFGRMFALRPLRIKGVYRYQAGSKFIDGTSKGGGREMPGMTDKGTISVVFYEVANDSETVDGNDLYTSPKIVAMVKHDVTSTNGAWKPFDLEIAPLNESLYKSIDLKNKRYKIAIVFSSSYLGDKYQGAENSTLDIDEVTLMATDKNP